MNLNKKIFGFTLAEVLITLGIIGVVASLTIPTLINNSLKTQTVTKLQKSYSVVLQALKLSEADNGPSNTWTYCPQDNGACTLTWYNTYLKPYMKNVTANITSDNKGAWVYLPDGTKISLHMGGYMDIDFYLNGDKSAITGKDVFLYELLPTAPSNAFRPYDYAASGSGRSRWTTGTNACNSASSTKLYCAGLIMYDGWQILDDYPYFN